VEAGGEGVARLGPRGGRGQGTEENQPEKRGQQGRQTEFRQVE
jgi:hypothetical protein